MMNHPYRSRKIPGPMKHIIWDWNGTLLNDLPVVIEAVNHALGRVGLPQITLDDYRTHYTRPVKRFYDRIAGREIGHDDWVLIDRLFHEQYQARVAEAELAPGAGAALAKIDRGPHDQSLLSMAPEAELRAALGLFDVARYFRVAQGNSGPPGGFKTEHLADHLTLIDADLSTVTMIGDTVDDGHAAIDNGINGVLYDDGSHHRADLESVGLPIADSIAEALEIALAG